MKRIYNAAKKSKKVNNIVNKNFRNIIINKFIEDKTVKKDLCWTQKKEERKIKNSWLVKKNN